MVAFGFLPQNFGRWQRAMNGTLSFCEYRLSDRDTQRWWGHSNSTYCTQKHLFIPTCVLLTPEQPGEIFTAYFFFFFLVLQMLMPTGTFRPHVSNNGFIFTKSWNARLLFQFLFSLGDFSSTGRFFSTIQRQNVSIYIVDITLCQHEH